MQRGNFLRQGKPLVLAVAGASALEIISGGTASREEHDEPVLLIPHHLGLIVADAYRNEIPNPPNYSAPDFFDGFGSVKRSLTATSLGPVSLENVHAVHGTPADDYTTLDDELNILLARKIDDGWKGLQNVKILYRYSDIKGGRNTARFQVTYVELSDTLAKNGSVVRQGSFLMSPEGDGVLIEYDTGTARGSQLIPGSLPNEYQTIVNMFVHERIQREIQRRASNVFRRS